MILKHGPSRRPVCQSRQWVEAMLATPKVQDVLSASVHCNKRLFHHFPDIGPDDLHQEVRTAALRALPYYDDKRAAVSTYLYRVAKGALLDLYKKRSRLANHEAVYATRHGHKRDDLK